MRAPQPPPSAPATPTKAIQRALDAATRADGQRPIPVAIAGRKARTPFAIVRLLYEAGSHKLSILAKENIENLVITPEIHTTVIDIYGPFQVLC
jgi:uncharacterized protein GlcG (DUF336 family)